jgi:hypothetical protein
MDPKLPWERYHDGNNSFPVVRLFNRYEQKGDRISYQYRDEIHEFARKLASIILVVRLVCEEKNLTEVFKQLTNSGFQDSQH